MALARGASIFMDLTDPSMTADSEKLVGRLVDRLRSNVWEARSMVVAWGCFIFSAFERFAFVYGYS